jgi:hypothetical protein
MISKEITVAGIAVISASLKKRFFSLKCRYDAAKPATKTTTKELASRYGTLSSPTLARPIWCDNIGIKIKAPPIPRRPLKKPPIAPVKAYPI